MYRKLLYLLTVSFIFVACDKDNEEKIDESTETPTGQTTNGSVVKAEYSIPNIYMLHNPPRACYTINWPAVAGCGEYNVYKSATESGGELLVTTTSEISTSKTETLSSGKHIRYYWVTAKINGNETPRPKNGGIKVTYTATLANKIWIPQPTPTNPVVGYYVTTGNAYDEITRVVAQNPIK